jgi:uncharacterized protein YegP (UPF0339 family)
MASKRRTRVRFYVDSRGDWRWSYYAGNGKLTADSAEGYSRLNGAQRGFASLQVGSDPVVEIERGGTVEVAA